MQQPEHVAVFWDFENLPPRSGVPGYETIQAIRSLAHDFGVIVSFKAYLEVSSTLRLWSELQASGVALIDCPHHKSGAEAASKMLLVDMITFAIDHPAPATIFLISGDRDFAYAISTLRHRKYKVVVLCPPDAHSTLVAQADAHFDWNTKVLREREDDGLSLSPPPPVPQRARHLSTSLNGVTSDSDRKGKSRNIKDEGSIESADLGQRSCPDHQTCSYSSRHDHAFPNTGSSWRTPSRTTSRPYSPAASFRSAQSAPQTLSPSPEYKTVKPTFVTDGDIVFESSSQPDLREGFPFSRNETTEPRTTQSSPLAPENTAVKTPSPVSTSLPVPSAGADNLWNSSTPAFAPGTLTAPVILATSAPDTLTAPVTLATSAPVTTTVPAPTAPISSTPPPSSSTKPIPTAPVDLTKQKASPIVAQPLPTRPAVAKPAPSHFLPLIAALRRRAQEQKQKQTLRMDLGTDLAKVKGLYAQAGVSKFASYIMLAEEAGIVTLGGSGSDQWVSLRPEWASSSRFPS
ncbi:hypothetical protein C0995_015030 [Termitomyces sp. Mi166|nr:hypothetical protein C0995_015030 [Termitomyces sp. Mi166\